MVAEPNRLRVLCVAAPADEAAAARSALERSGLTVEVRHARDDADLARHLCSPLDLILVWTDTEHEAPSPGRVAAVAAARGRTIPVVALVAPDGGEDVGDLAELGVDAVVYRDRPAPLAAIARRAGAAARRQDLVDFARAASHDLNNLLAPVPLATRILHEDLVDRKGGGFLGTVEDAVRRATDAVDSLYRVALWCGPERGPEPRVQARHAIEVTARHLREADPDLVVETEYPPDLELVEMPPGELRQIVHCMALLAAGRSRSAGEGKERRTIRIVAERTGGTAVPAGGDGIALWVSGAPVADLEPGADGVDPLAALRRAADRIGGTIGLEEDAPAGERARIVLSLRRPARATPPGRA